MVKNLGRHVGLDLSMLPAFLQRHASLVGVEHDEKQSEQKETKVAFMNPNRQQSVFVFNVSLVEVS